MVCSQKVGQKGAKPFEPVQSRYFLSWNWGFRPSGWAWKETGRNMRPKRTAPAAQGGRVDAGLVLETVRSPRSPHFLERGVLCYAVAALVRRSHSDAFGLRASAARAVTRQTYGGMTNQPQTNRCRPSSRLIQRVLESTKLVWLVCFADFPAGIAEALV
jgi:hypothetical protein